MALWIIDGVETSRLSRIVLAQNLGLSGIAGGVESEEQRRFLHLLRCDEGQGNLLNKPLRAEVFEEFLSRGNFDFR